MTATDPLTETLAWIEGKAQVVGFLGGLRTDLVDAGWSGPGAEQAALTLLASGMAANKETP